MIARLNRLAELRSTKGASNMAFDFIVAHLLAGNVCKVDRFLDMLTSEYQVIRAYGTTDSKLGKKTVDSIITIIEGRS
jgi:hypothetical protein